MPKFRVASRTLDELTAHKDELNAMFDVVKGPHGKLDRAGVKQIHEARYEIAELLVQLINDQVVLTDPTPFMCDVVTGDINADYLWQELHSDAALRVVDRAKGSKPFSQRLVFKEFGMSTSMKEIAVHAALEDMAAGRVTAGQLVEQVAFAVNRRRVAFVLDGIDAGVPSADDQTGQAGYTLRYAGLTDANLTKAIDGIWDDSDTPAVYGRHIVLAPAIRAFSGWSDEVLTEMQLRGQIGTFRGAAIVTLQDQYSRRADGHVIRTDRVYVAGGRKGAIYMTKDVSYLNYSLVDERTATFETGFRLEDGLLVWRPYNYRIITI